MSDGKSQRCPWCGRLTMGILGTEDHKPDCAVRMRATKDGLLTAEEYEARKQRDAE